MQKIWRMPAQPFLFRWKLGRIIALALGLWLLWVLFAGDTSLTRLWKLKGENACLRSEIGRLEQRLGELENEEKRLEEPEYLEGIAREKYGMIRDGEEVYRIIDDAEASE